MGIRVVNREAPLNLSRPGCLFVAKNCIRPGLRVARRFPEPYPDPSRSRPVCDNNEVRDQVGQKNGLSRITSCSLLGSLMALRARRASCGDDERDMPEKQEEEFLIAEITHIIK